MPIRYDERVGRSKLNIVQDGLRFLQSIVTLAEFYNPLKFFGVAGLMLMFVGFLLSLGPAWHYILYHEVREDSIYRLFTIMVLSVVGLNSITFGVSLRYILTLTQPRTLKETWLTKIFRPSVLGKLDKAGLILVICAVLLNWKTIYQYVMTAHIWLHWSYVFAGAFLFLIGTHLIMIGRLVRVFERLKQRSIGEVAKN